MNKFVACDNDHVGGYNRYRDANNFYLTVVKSKICICKFVRPSITITKCIYEFIAQ